MPPTRPYLEVTDYVQVNPDVFKNLKFGAVAGSDRDGMIQLHQAGRGYVLNVTSPMTHAARLTLNNGFYQPHYMSRGVDSFTQPYKKPILLEHGRARENEPIGRAIHAEYVDTPHPSYPGNASQWDEQTTLLRMQDMMKTGLLYDSAFEGLGYARVTAQIVEKDAVEKFLDGRYATFSIRTITDEVICPHCLKPFGSIWDYFFGMDEEEEDESEFCVHGPYAEVDGMPGFLVFRGQEFPESSVVSIPADVLASVNEMELVHVRDAYDKDSDDNEAVSEIYEVPSGAFDSLRDARGQSMIRPGVVLVGRDGKRRGLLAKADREKIELLDAGTGGAPIVWGARKRCLQPAIYLNSNSIPVVTGAVDVRDGVDGCSLLMTRKSPMSKPYGNNQNTDNTQNSDTGSGQTAQLDGQTPAPPVQQPSQKDNGLAPEQSTSQPVSTRFSIHDKQSVQAIFDTLKQGRDALNQERAAQGLETIGPITSLDSYAGLAGSAFCGPNRTWPVASKSDAIVSKYVLEHSDASSSFVSRVMKNVQKKGDAMQAWQSDAQAGIGAFLKNIPTMSDFDLADALNPLFDALKERGIEPGQIDQCSAWLQQCGATSAGDSVGAVDAARISTLQQELDASRRRQMDLLNQAVDSDAQTLALLRVLQDGLQASSYAEEQEKVRASLNGEQIRAELKDRMARETFSADLKRFSDGFSKPAPDVQDGVEDPTLSSREAMTQGGADSRPQFGIVRDRYQEMRAEYGIIRAEQYLDQMLASKVITEQEHGLIKTGGIKDESQQTDAAE